MKSVANALRALLLLNEFGELRIVDLSVRLGLAKSSAHRMLATLRSFGFVMQDEESRAYRVGPAFFDVAMTQSPDQRIIAAARRELESLAARTRETVNLLVLRGPDAFFLDGIEGTQTVRVAPRTGDRIPAYSTAAGKLLLAEHTPDEVYRLYPNGLQRLTPKTHSSPHDLVQELREIRRQGYAINIDESLDGVSAIAMKLMDFRGQAVAAVTVSVPSSRFDDEALPALIEPLRAAAQAISHQLTHGAGLIDLDSVPLAESDASQRGRDQNSRR